MVHLLTIVVIFVAAKQIWTQPMINGTPPPPRDSHSCTTVGDNLFVFGGTDGINPLNDLHILDTCKLFLCVFQVLTCPCLNKSFSIGLFGFICGYSFTYMEMSEY